MKSILVAVLGALAVCLMAVCGTYVYQTRKKEYYRGQLEQTIDKGVLEGLSKIGALNLNHECFWSDSVEVYDVSDLQDDPISHFAINTLTSWGNNRFNHRDFVLDVLEGGRYLWYEFQNCATPTPFMIVLE